MRNKIKIVAFFAMIVLFTFCGNSHGKTLSVQRPNSKGLELRPDEKQLQSAFSGSSYVRLLSAGLPNSKGIKLGNSKARLHAGVKTSQIYDDNIYFSESNTKGDWITIVEPMIGVVVPFGDNFFAGDYEFSEYLYAKYHKEDHPDHQAKGMLEINLTDYQIKIDEKYNRFTNRASIEDSTRVRQQNNNFRAGISTRGDNKLGFDIGYTNRMEDYISKDIIFGAMTYDDKDRMYHIADLMLLYRFAPKTRLMLEIDFGWIEYDSKLNPDSFYVEPLIGVMGQLTNKITANIKGGYRHQEYKTSELVLNEDFDNFVARGAIDFQPTENDLINLSIERSSYESTYRNINYYTGTFGRLTYFHKFSDKLSMTPYGTYTFNRYPKETTEGSDTKKRRDKLFGGGISLKYLMQDWLSFETKYDYKERDSNFNTFEYKNNTVSASATIGF